MMRALYTAVSGLKNHQTRMDVIGNNVANVNTTGYKSSRVTFADTLSQTISGSSAANDNIGGVNAKQIGLGMAVSSIDTNFTHGSASSTGNNTDLAIDTDAGLFVVKNGNQTYYTRNGNFTLDNEGNLVMNGSGLHVQGWNAVNGKVNPNGATENLKIDMDSTMQPKATSYVNFGSNLSADSAASKVTAITLTVEDADGNTQQVVVPSTDTTAGTNTNKYVVGDPYTQWGSMPSITGGTIKNVQLTLADGTTTSGVYGHTGGYGFGDNTFPSYTSMMTVYDSLGKAHAIPVMYERITGSTDADGNAVAATDTNKWLVSVPKGTYDGVETAGTTATIRFNGDTGKIDTTGTYATDVAVPITVPYPNGADLNTTIKLDFSNITQYSGSSNVNTSATDGYAAGFYKDMSIGQDGVITLTYTNGQKQQGGQIAIATFNNEAGLEKAGGSLYTASNNSGSAKIGTFDSQGVSVTPGALEMSNVDISNEFSDMIVTQRGFQANSKIITVADEMLDTLVNMKR